MSTMKLKIGSTLLIVGVLAIGASCFYLVQLGLQADVSIQGGDGANGWWQLIASVLMTSLGLVVLLSGATRKATRSGLA